MTPDPSHESLGKAFGLITVQNNEAWLNECLRHDLPILVPTGKLK